MSLVLGVERTPHTPGAMRARNVGNIGRAALRKEPHKGARRHDRSARREQQFTLDARRASATR